MTLVAVLFVESEGVYFNLKGVIPFDVNKDALTYKLKHPVVAHPPCNLWTKFAIINYKRWGGEHNRPKNDKGMFKFALDTVRINGGVLEHPAFSYAWQHYGLKKPTKTGWNKLSAKEYVCEVWQSAYGHKASKRTWLFYCGINTPKELNWERKKGLYQIGFQDQRGKLKNKPTVSGKEASRTPVLFRDELILLARNSMREVYENKNT